MNGSHLSRIFMEIENQSQSLNLNEGVAMCESMD